MNLKKYVPNRIAFWLHPSFTPRLFSIRYLLIYLIKRYPTRRHRTLSLAKTGEDDTKPDNLVTVFEYENVNEN